LNLLSSWLLDTLTYVVPGLRIWASLGFSRRSEDCRTGCCLGWQGRDHDQDLRSFPGVEACAAAGRQVVRWEGLDGRCLGFLKPGSWVDHGPSQGHRGRRGHQVLVWAPVRVTSWGADCLCSGCSARGCSGSTDRSSFLQLGPELGPVKARHLLQMRSRYLGRAGAL